MTRPTRPCLNALRLRERSVDAWGWRWLEQLRHDVRTGARTLLRAPAFSAVIVATLALGIALNTAMFTVVNAVLLTPLPYRDPARIVMFQNTYRDGLRTGSAAPAEFNWWRQQTALFEHVSAYAFGIANLTDGTAPAQIPIMRVSSEFFRLCGSRALLGRTFSADDDALDAPNTVVLNHGFWRRRFGGDPSVIGRSITLNGARHDVIGVMGADLAKGPIEERVSLSGDIEINPAADAFLPLRIDPRSKDLGHYFNVIGRLAPSVTVAEANERLQATFPAYASQWPPDPTAFAGFAVQGAQDAIVRGVRNPLVVLLGAVGCVLLIACANVASLLLARVAGRRREIAVRAAIGAGRGRIVRQLLTESLMLALMGGGLGLAAGYLGVLVISRLSPGIPRLGIDGANATLDARVLGLAIGLSVLTAMLCGLFPALQISGASPAALVNDGENRGSESPHAARARGLLVVVQTALAVVLMIGAALLIRSFIASRQVNPGFSASNVLTTRMLLTGPRFEDSAERLRVLEDGVRRLRAIPGVETAAFSCCLPLEDRFYARFQVVGRSTPTVAGAVEVSAGYFDTFQISVVNGRAFTERDERGGPVAMVNETLARQLWPGGDAVDQEVILDDIRRRVIGVAADVRDAALTRAPRPVLYHLAAHSTSSPPTIPVVWIVRTRDAPLLLSAAIREELREATGGLPVATPRTMEQVLLRSTAPADFNTLVLTLFAFSAVFLAGIGIFGLMAYSVAQRTRALAIEMALGAESSRIRNRVVRDGLRLALLGLGFGLVAAAGLSHLLQGLLFGVKPWDAQVFTLVPAVLFGVALMAAWWPAMRAGRINPVEVLR